MNTTAIFSPCNSPINRPGHNRAGARASSLPPPADKLLFIKKQRNSNKKRKNIHFIKGGPGRMRLWVPAGRKGCAIQGIPSRRNRLFVRIYSGLILWLIINRKPHTRGNCGSLPYFPPYERREGGSSSECWVFVPSDFSGFGSLGAGSIAL